MAGMESMLVGDSAGHVYQIYNYVEIPQWRGYRVGVFTPHRKMMKDASESLFSVVSRSRCEYACNDHGRKLEETFHPFNKGRSKSQKKAYYKCPVPDCTVAKWGGSTSTPADQPTRTARRKVMDLFEAATKEHGRTDDLFRYWVSFIQSFGALGYKSYEECKAGIAEFWKLVPSSSNVYASSVCRSILADYQIDPGCTVAKARSGVKPGAILHVENKLVIPRHKLREIELDF